MKKRNSMVLLAAIVILAAGIVGTLVVSVQTDVAANSAITVVSANETTELETPAEVIQENEKVETNETSEVESVEIITAKDIDFVITQFYLEGLLHLHAQTNIPREKILLEIIKIGNYREIEVSKIPIITDNNGMIFLDNQWVRFENGYAYKANFYYKGNKIASSTSGIVNQGKASFGFVTLSTQKPSQYSARIITQKYYDMQLYLDGETNIPLDHYIVGDIIRINETEREMRNVNKIIEVKPDKNGEITIDGKESRTISVPLGTGYYMLTLKRKNTNDTLCILGFEIIKEEKIFKGIHWVKNVYVPPIAI